MSLLLGPKLERKTNRLLKIDEKAFLYMYLQVRKDFVDGLVYTKRQCNEKEPKWWVPITNPGQKNRKEEKLVEITKNVIDLVTINMAIDIQENTRDRKEVLGSIKSYIPKDLWSGPVERKMGLIFLEKRVEPCIKTWTSMSHSPIALKDLFLRNLEKFFPHYFEETFEAKMLVENKLCIVVRLLVQPPKEEEDAALSVVNIKDKAEEVEQLATFEQVSLHITDC